MANKIAVNSKKGIVLTGFLSNDWKVDELISIGIRKELVFEWMGIRGFVKSLNIINQVI